MVDRWTGVVVVGSSNTVIVITIPDIVIIVVSFHLYWNVFIYLFIYLLYAYDRGFCGQFFNFRVLHE
jgi:hypothetical protein